MSAVLTALEHQALQVGDGRPGCFLQEEIPALIRLTEQCPRFCQLGNGWVRLANYAGLARVGGRLLEVLPKVSSGEMSVEDCRGILLRLLGLARKVPTHRSGAAEHALRSASLLEVFLEIYFDEVATLQRGGLIRRYQRQEADLGVIRGRFMLQRQIARHAMRPDRLACAFDELTPDNDWNRTLKAALVAARPWLSRLDLRRRWSELWAGFDGVSVPSRPAEVLGALSPDRQSRRYEEAVRWARWIIENLAPSFRAGRQAAPGMLFDMNRLFEEAFASHCQQRLAAHPDEWRLELQVGGHHLAMDIDTGRRSIGLRPDLLLTGPGGRRLIVDTKWKRPKAARGVVQPDEGDVYQMLAYAAAFRCEQLALVYPWDSSERTPASNRLRLPEVGGLTPTLDLVCVDVGLDGLPVRVGEETVLSRLLGGGP